MPDILIPDQSMLPEQIKDIARSFAQIFPTHPTDFGMLSGWKKDDQGNAIIGSKNNYTQTRKAKYADYRFHLTADQTEPRGIGMYPIDMDAKVSFIAVDVDEASDRADDCVLSLCNLVKTCGGHPYIERSVQGRWHFWFLPHTKMPMQLARKIAAALKARAESYKVPVELYPSTFPNEVTRRVGKYINLPYRGALSNVDDLKGIGVTYLIDPYVRDRINFTDDDYEFDAEEEHNGKDYGDPVLIYDLATLKLNSLQVQEHLAELGSQVIANQMREEARTIANMQTRNGNVSSIPFEKVIEAMKRKEPKKGNHHYCLLAIAGVACRSGVSKEIAYREINGIIPHWRQERGRDYTEEIKRAVDSTYAKGRDAAITGFTTLRKYGFI